MAATAVRAIKERLASVLRSERASIESIRAAIVTANAERRAIADKPRAWNEIEAEVDAVLKAIKDQASTRFTIWHIANPRYRFSVSEFTAAAVENPLALSVLLDEEAVRDALLRDQPIDGVSADERRMALEEADDRILCLECAEEVALRALDEATDSHVARRGDVSIDVLLAPSVDLEPFAARAEVPK
jgi:hypothetical protein